MMKYSNEHFSTSQRAKTFIQDHRNDPLRKKNANTSTNPETLNENQKMKYNIVTDLVAKIKAAELHEQLLMIVLGKKKSCISTFQ